MSNQNMTPKKHKYLDENSSQILDYDSELNGKLISPPYTSDESSHPNHQHNDHLNHQHNLRHRNSYRASISTNNTLSSPRSSEVMGEMIYDSGNNSIDMGKNMMGVNKESYMIMNHENEKIIPNNTKSPIGQTIDDLVIQRLSSSKRKKMRRIPSSSRNISSKMEMEINHQKNVINIANDEPNTRNYNSSSFKFTSLIDTNSEEFNSMPHSMQKKILQMIRNRQSAQKHRDKQKIERQNLIQENMSLRARIVELTNELQELRAKQLAILEQEGMLSHIKNGYRFTNYNMNTQLSNISGNIIASKRIDNINNGVNNRNSLGNEDTEINHHNIICNDNLLNEKSKTKIDNIGVKSQEIDCGFDFVPVDEYSNIGIWNSICDTGHVNANSGNHPTVNNNNIVRNGNLCNQLTIHPNIDVLPWIGGVGVGGVGGVGGVVTWNKQSNFVEDMLISSK
ncbi:transcription factor with central bZIP transcription factor domain [Cryptosporidium sp. chipmunk genotype I]|uniref:transcription factor with central bZIP transcription factor domain n=1 Tax=Cryptosporidium sp. chipmunk genotype I TaxID=1280935 RepID=UPI00351A5459|nr:transcription factor with central bZIP transcription factor domain [Cryptosporidium sp. chipmunk genotype I]